MIELSGGTLTNIQGYQSDEPDATITINRVDLETVIMGEHPLPNSCRAGSDQSTVMLLYSGSLLRFW